jgi:CRISPR system Cascade subunit CasA
MTQFTTEPPTFNLWTEPWITLERPNGTLDTPRGLEYTLLHAQDYRSLYEQSPLVVAGIHRLLVAILHCALKPNGKNYQDWNHNDLQLLWKTPEFPVAEIRTFGEMYSHRFDLFSIDAPFMQSSDVPELLKLPKKAKPPELETVAYLMPEIPTGSNVIHYRHGNENTDVFCPACAAKGLVIMPAFTAKGGPGKGPSINGTPPIYILPGGETLYHCLRASLTTRPYQPGRTVEEDLAWWTRSPAIVEFKKIDTRDGKQHGLTDIGYLHGLTFTPRRVWLKPEKLNLPCTRCGRTNNWVVRKIVYQAGEGPSHVNREEFWRDPFVSYYPTSKESKEPPKAIVPKKDIALWRNFVRLFLPLPADDKQKGWPAHVLLQIAQINSNEYEYPFRCVGMVTKDASAVEWLDFDLTVPLQLLLDPERGLDVRSGFAFAEDTAKNILIKHFRRLLAASEKNKRYFTLRDQMLADYWEALAHPFLNDFMPGMAKDERKDAYRGWIDLVVDEAKRAFRTYALLAGHDGNALENQARAISDCEIALLKKRKKHLSEKGEKHE